jgi:murein DD-endopeptidase MepM/ murein hydrolase activator NlpD
MRAGQPGKKRTITRSLLAIILLAVGLALTGCAVAASSPPPTYTPCAEPTGDVIEICKPGEEKNTALSAQSTPTAAAPVGPAGPTAPVESETPTPTPNTEALPSPTPLPSAAPSATPCQADLCETWAPLFFRRPVAPPDNDQVEKTYPFGSTQGGMRDPHHGVELLNPLGVPVRAAADGVVVVAGTDLDPTSKHGEWPITFYGPYSNFYGNLVVIEHAAPEGLQQVFPETPLPVYSLYGHLSEISVEPGEQVKAGQEIGKVGMTGIATGTHLHFEVRLGQNTYQSSRNPQLWLAPQPGPDGQFKGALAGSAIDSYGNNLALEEVTLEHLPNGPEQPSDFKVTLRSYEEKNLINQPPFLESFGTGDLPAGLYRISFPRFGLQEFLVQVYAGQLTVVKLRVE